MFRAEIIKLKRSSTWVIALLLPLLALATGTINLANNADQLGDGWASFTSQVVLFYGLLFYSMGISLLASTVWRMEHRGTNWNLLLVSTAQPLRLVLAKLAVIMVPVLLMQIVLVVGTAAAGVLILHLDGAFPWEFAAVGVIAVQSLLSMLVCSFAVPVALCLVGCVIGVAAVTSTALRPIAYVLPQAINTRALNLGSTAVSGSGALTASDSLPLLLTAVVIAAILIALMVLAIRTVKLR